MKKILINVFSYQLKLFHTNFYSNIQPMYSKNEQSLIFSTKCRLIFIMSLSHKVRIDKVLHLKIWEAIF